MERARWLCAVLWGVFGVYLCARAATAQIIDVEIPSTSTGYATGTLAVRLFCPSPGEARYPGGAPVIIWGPGGFESKELRNELPPGARDLILITFLFPGSADPAAGAHSDGFYDYRGLNCIQALRDVILYAAGQLTDDQGHTIDDVAPVNVLHNNIGLIGVSNGGNTIVAAAALYGNQLAGYLRYIIQWETPVSSQVATRDFGRVWLKPSAQQGDYFNPRYLGYGAMVLAADYSDLAYNPSEPFYKIFHDGNADGQYNTIALPVSGLQTPDLNLDGILQPTEDFPLDGYPHPDGVRTVYSRPVTQALASNNVFGGPWPPDVATPAVANTYWDIREAVRLYDEATSRIPSLEAMILAGVRDHVQSAPFKPHIRQALEGWRNNGAWVQLNPSPTYLIEADPILAGRSDLPDNVPNTLPGDWTRISPHCVPKDINSSIYQLASIRQMADRVEGVLRPAPAGADLITFVNSAGVGRIAVRIEVPERPRYPEGAPIVVEVSTWFVNIIDFHRVNETTRIGAITISYLWPEGVDRDSGARSEGVYDYGGPDSLAVLRDVIRFASGQIPDVDGRTIEDLVAVTALTENVGLFASSHSGVVATNVLAHHGGEMPLVKYLVGRENPTRDEMYPLELGHFDNQGAPVYNPFYNEDDYSSTEVTVDYSTVGWYTGDAHPDRPFFAGYDSLSTHILHPEICPKMWGKRYYSHAITQALLDNGALTTASWPADLASSTETLAHWPYRTTVHNYPLLTGSAPNLKVMLVFGKKDHVQAAVTKPHIHQAWDGFTSAAGIWVRVNPDRAYCHSVNPFYGNDFPDNDAESEPDDWHDIIDWGFPVSAGVREDVWLAAVAEMADRVHENNWDANLDAVFYPVLSPPPAAVSPAWMLY